PELMAPRTSASYPVTTRRRTITGHARAGGGAMAWVVLVVSGALEAVWAVALASSKGFTRPLPTALLGLALLASMAGLAYALRSIPVGTGYAVWVGIGAVGTALYGMVWLQEPVTFARIACLFLIIAGVVGLRLLS